MKSISRFLIMTISILMLTFTVRAQYDLYETTLTFPADYKVGDYITFLQVAPQSAGAGGYYEISISYTRGNIAAASTHIANVSHANPAAWKEAGMINRNPYIGLDQTPFTVDINTSYEAPLLRVRATGVNGINSEMIVNVKVRSLGITASWAPMNITGTETNPVPLASMTAVWNLWTGNPQTGASANLAITAIENGYVGIGTRTPAEKLSVNGTVLARKVKVTASEWPDYVFAKDYSLPSLQEVEKYIGEHKHLPGVPSATEVEREKVDLGAMNEILLRKIEELTLYLIEERKEREALKAEVEKLKKVQADK